MNVRKWCFSAAMGAFLVGSLAGVGCKNNSGANVGATQTAAKMKTEEMMHETPTAENMMHATQTAENMMHETPTVENMMHATQTAENMMHETPTP